MARPVCSVSSSANAGMCSSSARARRVKTLDRWRAGARDQTPDSKTEWAPSTTCLTSSEQAASTLHSQITCELNTHYKVSSPRPTCRYANQSRDLSRKTWNAHFNSSDIYICSSGGFVLTPDEIPQAVEQREVRRGRSELCRISCACAI